MNADSYVAPVPQERGEGSSGGRAIVLYRGAVATVTTGHLTVGTRRFPVAELTGIRREQHGGLLQSRRYELWATFRGQRLRVFQCRDAREFGQVCRALTRAREYAGVA